MWVWVGALGIGMGAEGALNLAPAKLWLQQGIAMKGEWESEARRGVQGVSSSAWFETMKVPVGNMPLWKGGSVLGARISGLSTGPSAEGANSFPEFMNGASDLIDAGGTAVDTIGEDGEKSDWLAGVEDVNRS